MMTHSAKETRQKEQGGGQDLKKGVSNIEGLHNIRGEGGRLGTLCQLWMIIL